MKVLEVPLKVHERYCGVRHKSFMTKKRQKKTAVRLRGGPGGGAVLLLLAASY